MTELIHQQKFTLQELPSVAKQIIGLAPDNRIFLFEASMGMGKTTLIHEICRQLGSKDNFSSPTFSLINEYAYPGGKIYHLDLYRIKNEEELLDLGLEEYLDSGNYIFIEWPDLVKPHICSEYIVVYLIEENKFRYISAVKNDAD